MMTLQARERFAPHFDMTHSLRVYPANSPRAQARLIVLALLADGRLDKREFDSLERHGVYAALGLSREDFVAVLFDFCHDVARLPHGEGNYLLSPGMLEGLFAEVDSPTARKAVMRHMFDTICSDGILAEGEERLFWKAIDAWNLRISDISPNKPASGARDWPPEHYYG